ncbi:LacI family DNA-binding transcriptional regulator [Cellulomonas hominis]
MTGRPPAGDAQPGDPGQARTTIHDVARLAGVSASTVSRAMTGGVVSPTTRQVVQRAAARLGYRPNRAAQGLVTGRTGTLGLVIPDLRNPFFADVAKGVSVRARALDVQVFISDTDEEPDAELESIRSLTGSTDGLLLCSPRSGDEDLLAAVGQRVTVTIHRAVPGLSSVTADLVSGTHQAVAHLHALGHSRVAYVPGPEASRAGGQRTAGLADTLPDVRILPFDPVSPTFEGGVAAADLVLASGATAVIAYNDLVALGLLHRFGARGVRVPEDFSVVGYDDVSMAVMASPSLTTVSVPKGKAGIAAVDLLLRRFAADGAVGDAAAGDASADAAARAPEAVLLPTNLIVRGSTGVAPGHR